MNIKKIKSIKIVEEDTHMYSINVENNHNYFSTGKLLSKNCFMILDEAQNAQWHALILFITRMGKNSKVLVTGDISQYDIAKDKVSFHKFIKIFSKVIGVGVHEFTSNDIVRAKILQEIVDIYDKWKDENNL